MSDLKNASHYQHFPLILPSLFFFYSLSLLPTNSNTKELKVLMPMRKTHLCPQLPKHSMEQIVFLRLIKNNILMFHKYRLLCEGVIHLEMIK